MDLFFSLSSYHKIGGDMCAGGVESSYSPTEVSCCLAGSDSGSSVSSIVLGCLVLVVLLIIAVFAVVLIVCLV